MGTKRLRVRTREGWTTQPVTDNDENRLEAVEVDETFLELESQQEQPGTLALELTTCPLRDGWGVADGADIGAWADSGIRLPGVDRARVKLSRDGRYVAAWPHLRTDSEPLIVFDIAAEAVVYTGPEYSGSGCFSDDGEWFAYSENAVGVVIIDTATWGQQMRRVIELQGGLPSNDCEPSSVLFSPNRRYIAGTTATNGFYMFLYDLDTDTMIAEADADWNDGTSDPTSRAAAMAWRPDSSELAFATGFDARYATVSPFAVTDITDQLGSYNASTRGMAYTIDGAELHHTHNDSDYDYYTVYDATNNYATLTSPVATRFTQSNRLAAFGKYMGTIVKPDAGGAYYIEFFPVDGSATHTYSPPGPDADGPIYWDICDVNTVMVLTFRADGGTTREIQIHNGRYYVPDLSTDSSDPAFEYRYKYKPSGT